MTNSLKLEKIDFDKIELGMVVIALYRPGSRAGDPYTYDLGIVLDINKKKQLCEIGMFTRNMDVYIWHLIVADTMKIYFNPEEWIIRTCSQEEIFFVSKEDIHTILDGIIENNKKKKEELQKQTNELSTHSLQIERFKPTLKIPEKVIEE